MKISSYKELIAYRKALELVLQTYQLTRLFPKEELFGLTSQLRRSAVSIPSNIAEGYVKGSREYVQHLRIALGSAAELETQLSLSSLLGYCRQAEFEGAYMLNEEVMKLIRVYISRLSSRTTGRELVNTLHSSGSFADR